MLNSTIKCVALATMLLPAMAGQAQTFSDSATASLQTSGGGTATVSMKLYRPQGAATPWQGVVVVALPNAGRTSNARLVLNNLSGMADSARLALVVIKSRAEGNGGLADYTPLNGNQAALLAGLQALATAAGRAEIANAPLLVASVGAVGRFAHYLALANPARVAAIASIRPDTIAAPAWASVAPYAGNTTTEIPHLVLAGEVSGPDVRKNLARYLAPSLKLQVLARRAQGARIHLAVEMNASQNTLKDKSLRYLSAFFKKAAAARIPANSDATNGPIALTAVAENSGYLAQAAVYNNFRAANYSTAAFGGALPGAQSNWLFDATLAQTWRSFHVSRFDSAIFFPESYQFIPYCSGRRPSPVSARWQAPGIQFDSNNVFQIELSDAYGNFDNDRYPARFFGGLKTTQGIDTISNVLFPDNNQFNYAIPAGTQNRYRMRVTSSSPYTESYNSGEILYFRLCPITPPPLYLSHLTPLKKRYSWGDSASVMIYKTATATLPTSGFLRVVLSDSSGQFKNTVTRLIDSVAASFVGDSMRFSFEMPQVNPSLRYRIRVQGHGDVFVEGTSNGHDVALGDTIVGARFVSRTLGQWLAVAPNPARGQARLTWSKPLAAPGQLTITDVSGRRIATIALAKGQTSHELTLPATGLLLIRITDGQTHYLQKVVAE